MRRHVYQINQYDLAALEPIIELLLQKDSNKHEHDGVINLISTAKFTFKNLHDALAITHLVVNNCSATRRHARGVFELLSNAVEHGLLNIGFETKNELLRSQDYGAEIKKRYHLPEYREQFASLVYSKQEKFHYIQISNSGSPFDPTHYLEIDPNRATAMSGRGIAFAKHHCFDQLSYSDDGRTVTAAFSAK